MAARLISVQEAAKLLGVTPQSVRNWIDKGYITAHQVGDHQMVDRETIERYFDGLQEWDRLEKTVREKLDRLRKEDWELDDEIHDVLMAKEKTENTSLRGVYRQIVSFAVMNSQSMFSDKQQQVFRGMMGWGNADSVAKDLGLTRSRVIDIFNQCLKIIHSTIRLKEDREEWERMRKENLRLKAENVTLRQQLNEYKKEEPKTPPPTPEEILRQKLNTPFVEFRFFGRAYHVLKDLGCKTLGDVAALQKSTLEAYPRCGKKTIEDIENELIEQGLSFGMRVDVLLGK
jgi:excisionase family DNA binding protein